MEEQACPRCKTTKYRNPSLKLMVNVCGHTLCESCVDMLFLKGSGACPECMVPLRRNNFRVQLFEDPMVEKEVDIRRRILRDYNKREEDFATLEEFNDYLEEIEDIVYNLCNNIEIIETNKRIEAYKRDNREVIQRNKTRVGRDEYALEELLELEKAQEEARKKELDELETEHKKKKARDKQALIEELMYSGKDAAQIVTEFAEKAEKQREEEKQLPPPKNMNEFSTGIKFGQTTDPTLLPAPLSEEGPLFVYEPLIPYIDGPTPPEASDIKSMGYITHMRQETPQENAGGFTAALACQRALQEALQCLYYTPNTGLGAAL
ncbi:Mat1 [Drosophila busckii]|uniref:CDK-activating kinase assembly factor MAT1 n=1 Tax=Drosophila busckii TaxID=30019 RepID=A0A0M4EB07_DROBS|nr:CDK-activating kinase assembly factor MAT1 [Drosophila busckii]ALC40627.1 Mat1 [Drosophila busckii]